LQRPHEQIPEVAFQALPLAGYDDPAREGRLPAAVRQRHVAAPHDRRRPARGPVQRQEQPRQLPLLAPGLEKSPHGNL
jgi:hypothetical protein